MDRRIDEVVGLMRDNLHRRLTVDEMAGAVGVSPSRLRQLFKTETGTSPVQYLRNLRLEQAKELLETTFLSVKEIAARGGVTNVSHFVKNFATLFGRTPASYRSQKRKTKRVAAHAGWSHWRNGP